MSQQFSGITVYGLYDDVTGNAMFGVTGAPVPGDAIYIAGDYNGNLTPLSVASNGYLNVNATVTPPTDNTSTGSITSNQNVAVSTSGFSALQIQVTGTWTGTLDFQVSIDGTTWYPILVYPVLPDGTPSVSSTTANGTWQIPVGGFQMFRVLGNTVATGSASIYLTAGAGQYSVLVYSDNAANLLATAYQGGTWTVQQGGAPWSQNITEWNSVALGSPTAWGTAPTGNVIGVNAELFAGNTALTATGSSLNVDVTNTVTVTGTVAVTQSTSPWIVAGSLTNNNAAPTSNNVGVLPAIASTAAQAYTTGDQVLLNTTLAGAIRSDLYSLAGTALGAPSNFGTAPGAVEVIGTNSNIFTAGAAITATNTLFDQISDGTHAMGAMADFGTSPGAVYALNVNASLFSGTTALTNTGGSLNVEITGSSGTVTIAGNLTNNNAAPAANNLGVLGYVATASPETYTQGNQVAATTSLGGAVRTVPVDEANASSLSYYEIDNANTFVSVTTAFTPVMAWQTNSASFIYLIRMLQFFSNGTIVEFVMLKNPTVTGGSFVAASGHLNYNVTATSYSGGTKVLGGYASTVPFFMDKMLDAMAAGAPGDTFAIEARSFSGTGSVVTAMRWSEQTAAL